MKKKKKFSGQTIHGPNQLWRDGNVWSRCKENVSFLKAFDNNVICNYNGQKTCRVKKKKKNEKKGKEKRLHEICFSESIYIYIFW